MEEFLAEWTTNDAAPFWLFF